MSRDGRKPETEELEKFLKNADSVENYFEKYGSSLYDSYPAVYLARLMDKKNILKSTLLNKITISKSFYYEIMNGRKLPGRNSILQILIAMGLNLDECQKALKTCGYNPLYARNRRDAIIFYCIENNMDVIETNILLESLKLTLL